MDSDSVGFKLRAIGLSIYIYATWIIQLLDWLNAYHPVLILQKLMLVLFSTLAR